jgi:hypothetical protein
MKKPAGLTIVNSDVTEANCNLIIVNSNSHSTQTRVQPTTDPPRRRAHEYK